MKKINIVVLNFNSGEVDIITAKVNSTQIEEIEKYLIDNHDYKLSEIEFMYSEKDIEINYKDEV